MKKKERKHLSLQVMATNMASFLHKKYWRITPKLWPPEIQYWTSEMYNILCGSDETWRTVTVVQLHSLHAATDDTFSQ